MQQTAAPRPRRIVRRAVISLAVVVLLPVGYLGSVMMLYVIIGAGLMPVSARPVVITYISPMELYWHSDMPGGTLIGFLVGRAFAVGEDLRR